MEKTTEYKAMTNRLNDDSDKLIALAGKGDPHALGELLLQYRDRLTKIISFRIDKRLKGRVDPSDIVQDAFIEVTQRFSEYYNEQKMPFFLWLRFITVQKLIQVHRHHLGVKARDANREVSIFNGPLPQATSAVLAAQLMGKQTSPSMAAMRVEAKMQLEHALNEMDEIDREVLAMRHFEQLNNAETAKVLNISESAASNRYIRAIKRLQQVMRRNAGSMNESGFHSG